MSQTSDNNKRIAKNTLMLYIRMFFMMGMKLFTSRVILEYLGITDYGIYNVVGGIVAMLSFLKGSMSNAVMRFLTYEMGRKDSERINRVFCVSIYVHFAIALIMIIVMEIGGVWYLNTHMNIPSDRLVAANWVLQCSIITTLFTIFQVPFNSMIIAKERMSIFAYISIIEVILRLLIVYLLVIGNFDRLKLYAVLTALVTVFIMLVYMTYCRKKFQEVKFRLVKDWTLFHKLISFSGWSMISELAWSLTGPGVNIILNSFFGPVVNAARGLANQVNGAVSGFVSNFQTAVNPQIIKNYAASEIEDMKKLVYRSSRFSYYLLFALSLPLMLKMDYVLHLWLKEVPEYSTQFCQLTLVASLVTIVSNLLPKIVWANGNIRNYQIIISSILCLNFPLSYLVLKCGASPIATVYVNISIQAVLIYVRLRLMKSIVDMPGSEFFKNVVWQIILVTITASIIPFGCAIFTDDTFVSFIVVATIAVASVCFTSFYLGMNADERSFVIKTLAKIKNKFIPTK